MKELYFVNGNKEKSGSTWRELLQGIYVELNTVPEYRRYWDAPKKKTIDDYLVNYMHNSNDRGSWTYGRYERVRTSEYQQQIGEDGQPIHKWDLIVTEVNGAWIPPMWKPATVGWYWEDSFGRIIPSGYIKDCYKLFKPDTSVKKRERHWYSWRRGTGTGRVHCGRRYAGNHGGFGMEVRSTSVFKAELRELNEEFDVNIKWNVSRAKWVELAYTDWDCIHYNSGKGKGWKRTRKRKQYM